MEISKERSAARKKPKAKFALPSGRLITVPMTSGANRAASARPVITWAHRVLDFQVFARDMRLIRARLRGIVNEREVRRWLRAPNPNLGGLTPTAAIAQGDTRYVLEMSIRIEEGRHV